MRWILWLLAGLAISGCTTTSLVRATPIRTDGQDEIFRNGTPILSSRGSRADVAVAPKGGPTGRYERGPRIAYFVFVRNRSESRILVSERNVQVRAAAFGRQLAAKVLSANEVEDQIRSDAAWAKAVNAFAFAASSMSATEAGTTYHSFQVLGAGQLGTTTVTGESYSPAVTRQELRREASEAAAAAEKLASREKAALDRVSELFQTNTLEPGEGMSGAILIERPIISGCLADDGPLECELTIFVEVSGETHRFTFTESE